MRGVVGMEDSTVEFGLLALALGEPSARPEDYGFDLESFLDACPQLELLTCLGRGGMGIVFRARQRSLERDVALKLLSPALSRDIGFKLRFEQEARTLAALRHPGIVAIHDANVAAGVHYLVLELVEGDDLRKILRRERRLDWHDAVDYVAQLCDALAYAHGQGVIHRDIKPANVLVENTGLVRVTDFGIAKLQSRTADETVSGTIAGTPSYMAPEQRCGRAIDARTDIFSAGVLLYELLTGVLPMGKFREPSSLGDSPRALDRIVERALESDPSRRFPSADAFAQQLRRIGTRRDEAADAPIPARQAWGRVALVAFVSVLVVAWVVVGLSSWFPTATPDIQETDAGEVEPAREAATDDGIPPLVSPPSDWLGSALSRLHPDTHGVVVVDWTQLRGAPLLDSALSLVELPLGDSVCAESVIAKTDRFVVALDQRGRPLEAVLRARWSADELAACIADVQRQLRAVQVLEDEPVEVRPGRMALQATGTIDLRGASTIGVGPGQPWSMAALNGDVLLSFAGEPEARLRARLGTVSDPPSPLEGVASTAHRTRPVWWSAAIDTQDDAYVLSGSLSLWTELEFSAGIGCADVEDAATMLTDLDGYVSGLRLLVPALAARPRTSRDQENLLVDVRLTMRDVRTLLGPGSPLIVRRQAE